MKHRDARIRHKPALLSLLAMLATGTAFAHSKQETTFPEDGAVLPAPPVVVSMSFDTPMRVTVIHLTSETTGATFKLERTDGMQPVTDFQADAARAAQRAIRRRMARTLARRSPHEVSLLVRGRAVGAAVWQSVFDMDAATLTAIAVKALAYFASLSAAGSALVVTWLSSFDDDIRRMVRRLGLAGALVAGLASAALLPLGAVYLAGGIWAGATDPTLVGMVAAGPAGESLAVRVAGLVVIGAFFVSGRVPRSVAVAGAAIVCASFAFRGHVLAEPRVILGALLTAHLLGLAFWIGASPRCTGWRRTPIRYVSAGRRPSSAGGRSGWLSCWRGPVPACWYC